MDNQNSHFKRAQTIKDSIIQEYVYRSEIENERCIYDRYLRFNKYSCCKIDHEFGRRCTISEPIVNRLADDLIARYSPKHQPHPEFFKEDTALAFNQLTLFIDQYIQIMRKYPFLERATTILSSLTSACLKVNQFLAKQLYHYMKSQQPTLSKQSAINELCAACGKNRENEKIRVLREELNMPRLEGQRKVVRQVIGRNGQRYDMQELIQEQLENLDVLNEEEVRKRLGMLQLDHDRRNQEMLICLQELGRANDRVAGYNKTLEKKAKEGEVRFNIKDYVFQLSRHFYHNLSNLDIKIKQLKQNISPIQTVAAQTDVPCISLQEHEQQLKQIQQKIDQLQRTYYDTKTILYIEQQKNKEEDETIHFLQQKISQIQIEKEQDKINWTIAQTRLNAALVQSQEKMVYLQKLVKKLKGITKAKNLGLSDEDLQCLPKTESNGFQFPEESNVQSQRNHEQILRSYMRAMVDNRKQWKQSLLVSPSLVLPQDDLDYNNIKVKGIESIEKAAVGAASHKAVLFRLRQSFKQVKLSLSPAFSQCLYPAFVSYKSVMINGQNRDDHVQQQIIKQMQRNEKINTNVELTVKKGRLSRMQSNKRTLDKIATINNRRSLLAVQNQQNDPQSQELNQQQRVYYNALHEGYAKKQKLKTTLHEHLNFNDENRFLRQQLGLEKKQIDTFQVGYEKRKKRRNLSQENSLEDVRDYNYRASAERPEWNQKKIFNELNNVLQTHKGGGELDKKVTSKKRSFYTRGEYQKAALSLQQINYSTLVYSLTAKLHLKSPGNYVGLKKFLCLTSGLNCQQQNSIKNALKTILINHRACNSNGTVCRHMEALLDKIKTM